jgi:TolB-like protein/DNA-binding winged helix-turn-helix (wHTH) protein/Tfp pilus assembly protein PilF
MLPQAYEFGPYRLEPGTRRLLRDVVSGSPGRRRAEREGGSRTLEPVSLTPKAFELLLALIERRDRAVDKAELMRLVWADSFVEESNLSQTIFVLRKTLGESVDGARFIETVPRRGYRFSADVRAEFPKPAIAEEPEAAVEPIRSVGGRAGWFAAAAAAVIVLASLGAWIQFSGDAGVGIDSLVVLPFENLSGDRQHDPLAESMTDALITSLGQISGLRVISRTSALTYVGTSKTLPQIARELNVAAVVEGTVQQSAGRLQVNLKLIDASSDRTLWAESYQRDPQNALELTNQIARAIANRTAVTLTPRETARLAETIPVNPKVYEAHLKGRYFWNRRTEPDMQQAIFHFEEARRLDPDHAPAYSGLADSYALYGSHGWTLAGGDPWKRALAAAERALELDPLLADGHTSRARIALNYELDWDGAGGGYRRALELNPGYANAHHWYGYYLMLRGDVSQGRAEMQRALELDPLSPVINANIGFSYYVARDYDAALAHWRRVLEMHRNYALVHSYMTGAYVAKGMYTEALAQLQKAVELSGEGTQEKALLAHIYGRMGRTGDARALLSELMRRGDAPGYDMAIAFAGIGDHDHAFSSLDKTLQQRWGPFNELNAEPLFDALRSDARFPSLLRRIRLPGYYGRVASADWQPH